MAARTLGWAQEVLTNGVSGAFLNGVLGTAIAGSSIVNATDQPFEVTAGVPVSIRWGVNDTSVGAALSGWTLAANTQRASLQLMDETTNTLWDGAAVSVTFSGGTVTAHDGVNPAGGAGTAIIDRTFTFTPTHSGTMRIRVRAQGFVTATSTIFSDFNTESSRFGGAAQVLPATVTVQSFTPGLIRVGTALTSVAQSGASPYLFTQPVTTIQNTLTLASAQMASEASETFGIDWLDSLDVVILSGATTAGAAAAKTDAAKNVNPAAFPPTAGNNFPATSTAVGLEITANTSTLSTDNGGAALSWIHLTGALPAGYTQEAGTAAGATEISKASVMTVDARLQVHVHSQKPAAFAIDTGAPAPFDNYNHDDYLYVISADLYNAWFAAFNMAPVPIGQNTITGSCHLGDPNLASPTSGGGSDHPFSLATTTVGGNTLGWSRSTTPFGFTPAPPAGQWHVWCESATDGTSTWSRLNGYLVFDQGHADPIGPFALFATGLGFVSAFRGNLAVAAAVELFNAADGANRNPTPGDSAIFWIRLLKDKVGLGNFAGYQVDVGTIPFIKITRFQQTTPTTNDTVVYAIGSDLGGVNMTQSAVDPAVWFYVWAIPSNVTQDVYHGLFSAQVDGAAISVATDVLVAFDSAFDPVNFATSGGISFKPI